MVEHYETCLNNSYLSSFYGEQYINQLYNVDENLEYYHLMKCRSYFKIN